MKPHIRRLFDAFGPRRCYWGTDLTNSFTKATYKQRITHFTETLDFLSAEDKEWIMGRGILARLGWASRTETPCAAWFPDGAQCRSAPTTSNGEPF